MSIHAMSDDEFADFDRDPADIHNPEPTPEELDECLRGLLVFENCNPQGTDDPENEENYDDLAGVPDPDADMPDWADDFEASDDI